ncbi:serine/threonine-protein kinase [Streptomyces sp. NPDC005409]|uniref:serine/threonine-protein kinase n=1 Tax=Streptomyces sp. NPDC005409 TaxID=3155342 RepID=UPI003456B0A5
MGTEGENARLIAGRYRLDARLGRGGMGIVWRATDQLLGRSVAVKEVALDPTLSGDEARLQRERTLREARAAAQLKHPHIIVVHDIVEDHQRPYIVMELVEGGSLADRLSRTGPVTPAEAAGIGIALLGALRTAHAAGVLHRDLKPANVLLEAPGGRAVLTDFGIAQVAGATTLTSTGAFVGSPEYTAPERMSPEAPVGPESDLWSLGALLCAAVSGVSPFRRDSLGGILHAVVFDEVRPPAACGPLLPVVRGLLERDPGKRLGAAQAETLLRACLDDADGVPSYTPTQRSVTGPTAEQEAIAAAAPAPTAPLPPASAPTVAPASAHASAPTPGKRGRRAALIAGLLVAALAGAGLSAATLLMNDDARGAKASANGGGGAGGSSRTPAATAPREKTGPASPSVTPAAAASPDDKPAPAGYHIVNDPAGFSLAVPTGFTRTLDGPRIFYMSPGETFRIGIKVAAPESGGPLAVHQRAHAKGPASNPGYRDAEVVAVTRDDRQAALWRFTWDGFSAAEGPRQTRDLCWEEGGRLYDVWVSAPVGRAEEARGYLDTAVRTFVRTEG